MTRVAIDTNVLAYAEGLVFASDNVPKIKIAQDLLEGLIAGSHAPVVPVQALAELHRLLLRKGRLPGAEVASRIARLRSLADMVGSSPTVFDEALTLSGDHGLHIFDAIILAAAVEGRCDILLSEDLQDGFAWRGVVVTNPFGDAPDRRIAAILAGPRPTPPSPP